MSTDEIPTRQMPFRGVDRRPEDRPGVPREARPHRLPGAHWDQPAQQPAPPELVRRLGMQHVTPVFSTVLPLRGLSGVLRRAAHQIPDHRVSHWLILLLADRVDVLEGQLLPGELRR